MPGPISDSGYGKGEKQTPYQDVTTYNNFYEFGTDKEDPAANAHTLKIKPWTVKVEGKVAKPADYHLEDLLKPHALEERVYRLRCVERWSMVIPWVGFPLASFLKRIQPDSTAKFVEFATLYNPQQMPGTTPRCARRGPTSKGCVSTKRCIRSRFWPSASTASICRTRTARRSG